MDYTPPPVGSVVRFTIEGLVTQSEEDTLSVNGVYIELTNRDEEAKVSYVTITDAPKPGDLGYATGPNGERTLVMFRVDRYTEESGWFDSTNFNWGVSNDVTRIPVHTAESLIALAFPPSEES